MSNFSRRSILIGLPILVTVVATAAEKRLALKGYDPVSYFTEGRPEQGSAEYQAVFDDATYWFKNAEHRGLFVADPEAWAIADGRLYVFAAKQAIPMFEAQTASIVANASDNWAKLRNTP